MRRSQLSLVTAAVVLLCALIWLALGNAVSGLLWAAISFVWLVTAFFQRSRSDAIEPTPGRRLLRRFSRLILLWS